MSVVESGNYSGRRIVYVPYDVTAECLRTCENFINLECTRDRACQLTHELNEVLRKHDEHLSAIALVAGENEMSVDFYYGSELVYLEAGA